MQLHSKTLGSTIIVGLIPNSPKHTALGWKLTITTMETEFAWANNQVQAHLIWHLHHVYARHRSIPKGQKANKAQQQILNFIEVAGVPCHFIVYFDSHVNSLTGSPQVTCGGRRPPRCSTIDKMSL